MYLSSVESRTVLPQVVATLLVKELVLAIARTDEPGVYITVNKTGDEQVTPSCLQEFIKYVEHFEATFNYPRDKYLDVFWQACQDVGVEWWPALHSINSAETGCMDTHRTINALVERIRQLRCERRA